MKKRQQHTKCQSLVGEKKKEGKMKKKREKREREKKAIQREKKKTSQQLNLKK